MPLVSGLLTTDKDLAGCFEWALKSDRVTVDQRHEVVLVDELDLLLGSICLILLVGLQSDNVVEDLGAPGSNAIFEKIANKVLHVHVGVGSLRDDYVDDIPGLASLAGNNVKTGDR